MPNNFDYRETDDQGSGRESHKARTQQHLLHVCTLRRGLGRFSGSPGGTPLVVHVPPIARVFLICLY